MRKPLVWGISALVVLVSMAGWGLLTLRGSRAPREVPRATSPEVVLHTQRAAHSVRMREMARARQELAAALGEQPSYAPALLVQACIALEEGDATVLRNALDQLQAVAPEQDEPRLLRKLMEHRRGPSPSGWRQAFLSAWIELGRPSFADSPLLPEPPEGFQSKDFIPAEAWERATTASTRLALTFASEPLSEEQARWLLEQVPSIEETAWVYAAAEVLREDSLSAALRAEAAPVLRRRLEQVAQAAPNAIQPRLLLLMGSTSEDAALSAQELDSLEPIAALPAWRNTSFLQAFLGARDRLKQAGVPAPGRSAFPVAVQSLGTTGPHLLRKRAQATRSQLLPGARYRLGHILWRIGVRMAEAPTILEHMVGFHLMVEGAEDMQDLAERDRVARMRDEAFGLLESSRQVALEKWPLPSLAEELLEAASEDELTYLRAFAEPSPAHASP